MFDQLLLGAAKFAHFDKVTCNKLNHRMNCSALQNTLSEAMCKLNAANKRDSIGFRNLGIDLQKT